MVNSTYNPSTADEQTTTAVITTINQVVTTIAPTTTAEVDSDPNCRKLIQYLFYASILPVFDLVKIFLVVFGFVCRHALWIKILQVKLKFQ